MANVIQHRRGLEEDFQANKLLPGELAVSTDTENVYMGIRPGRVKKLAGQGDVDSVESEVVTLQENLNATLSEILANTSAISQAQKDISLTVNRVEMSEDRKYAYFYHDDEMLYEIGPFAGEGGGGGGGGGESTTTTTVTINNTSGWLAKSIAPNTDCPISCTWSSTLDEIETGDGVAKVIINGSSKMTLNVAQGEFTVNPARYLGKGQNRVRIQVTDSYENSKYINFTVTVVDMSLTSRFNVASPFSGEITFPYTPYGEIEKTVHFILDGTEIATETTSVNGRQLTKVIPAQSHGAHKLEAYFVAEIDGVDVESNHLKYEFMSTVSGNNIPIISSDYDTATVDQYSTIAIKYRVYIPNAMSADIVLSANGTTVNSLTVDRNEQTWSYRAMTEGNLSLTITCGSVTKTFPITVTKSAANIEAETQDLELYLSAQDRSNGEANPATWTYGNISASFTGFNWTSDGWQLDGDNNSVLRLSEDARVTIPLKLFEHDFKQAGKTIEFEFSTSKVRDYDAPVIQCWSGERGVMVTAQKATLKSEQSEIYTQYKEDEHVRVSFVVEKSTENRLIYIYTNGIMSGVVEYPGGDAADDFSQLNPVNISIGSSDCTTDIYCIRVYSNDLDRHKIMGNYTADRQNVEEMLTLYDRNNVFDEYGNIVIEKLPNYIPYLVLNYPGRKLPQYKGDKVTVSGYFVDPLNPSRSFSFENAEFNVQGTSSQFYKRKNYKSKFKNGIAQGGQTVSTWQMNSGAIPTKEFCLKADVASSEGANNVVLAMLYNEACPYKTPAQEEDSRVRQGIEGFPCLIFADEGDGLKFLGRYNFNNDKGTPEVFGFVEPDESIEVKNNTSARVLFQSDDFTTTIVDDSGNVVPEYLNDFEWRFPEDLNDPEQLSEFVSWVVSTNTEEATGNAITPVTYGGVTYSTDTAEYRLAKFKAEAGEYMELDSMLFYYLFTELFTMVDSRAKNMFPSFIGSEVTA